jgi:hypothetical protein
VVRECTTTEILIDVCWALSYLSDSGEDALNSIIAYDIGRRLIELLGHHDVAIVVPCLRALGNVATGSE